MKKLSNNNAIVSIKMVDKKFFVGYYPIETNRMCLPYHGNPKNEIQKGTMNAITKLYPNDKAEGYDENQLRGNLCS